LPNLYPILNISLFGIIPQYNRLEFSQWTGTTFHRDKRGVTLKVLRTIALITALAGISYGVVANQVTAKNLIKVKVKTRSALTLRTCKGLCHPLPGWSWTTA
jgi:hypothetical protein